MNRIAEQLTNRISAETAPGMMGAEEALETLEEVSSWLEGSIEALRGEIEEWKEGEREVEP